MSDYRVELKVKNNNILRKLEECGYTSVGDFCRRNGKMHWASNIGDFVNLKKSPITAKGRFFQVIEDMCEILLCSPEELFTDIQLTTALESNRRSIEVNEAQMKYLMENQKEILSLEDQTDLTNLPDKIEQLLETLTPREAKIIAMRFGLGDYEQAHNRWEIAQKFDVTTVRITQIEEKALRKLRSPHRRELVLDYIE